jgi:hypothetical protein
LNFSFQGKTDPLQSGAAKNKDPLSLFLEDEVGELAKVKRRAKDKPQKQAGRGQRTEDFLQSGKKSKIRTMKLPLSSND